MIEVDPLYIEARRTLLDAVDALNPHLASVILVGAQAVYLRTESSSIGIAPYTTDADLTFDPGTLAEAPAVDAVMEAAGFAMTDVGTWSRSAVVAGEPTNIDVDLMIPDRVAPGSGRRSVDLVGHDRKATRRTVGLEAALVDHDPMEVRSLVESDSRSFLMEVAGPGGLLVSKVHKIVDRAQGQRPDRLRNKDAGDLYRMFQVIDAREMAGRLSRALADPASEEVTTRALSDLRTLFGRRGGTGIEMIQAAVGVSGPAAAAISVVSTNYVERIVGLLG